MMVYDPRQMDALLGQIPKIAPTVGYFVTEVGVGASAFGIARKGRSGADMVKIPTGGADREISVRRIMGLLSRPRDVAEQLLGIGEQVHGLNPAGYWCVQPDGEAAPVEFDVRSPPPGQAVAQRLQWLADKLPEISEVRCVRSLEGQPNGRLMRRQHLRFIDRQGMERAALDTRQFNVHIESMMTGQMQEHYRRNMIRARIWAEQLDVELTDLPLIFADLTLYSLTCQARRIVLNP